MALINLDSAPRWFASRAGVTCLQTQPGRSPGQTVRTRCQLPMNLHYSSFRQDPHLTCGLVAGTVQLLTHPIAAGYIQNPISVYYCYSAAGKLSTCIAEVTNTPWCV